MKTFFRKAVRFVTALALAATSLAAPATVTTIFFHSDLAGSPIAATDESGNLLWKQSFKPNGERLDPKAPAIQAPWFTGKAFVEGAGLSYFGARWYDPQVGRLKVSVNNEYFRQ